MLLKIIFFLISLYIVKYHHKHNLRVAYYTYSLKGGGTERVTALFINYLSVESDFDLYVFSQKKKEKFEYKIPQNIQRIKINGNEIISTKNLIKKLLIKKIDVFIYQFPYGNEIKILNKLKNIKIIIFSHFCFLTWIYFYQNHCFKELYNAYKESKYIVTLVPFENDFIFKKWGIKSILMNNLITYEYDDINPSNLTSKIIIMIGRGSDKYKRFSLGIKSMKYIEQKIPESEMKIISDLNGLNELEDLVKSLNLEKKVSFIGYTLNPEEHFKNASLHIFPTISEAFPMVLSETKIFGIPNILTGLDFVSISKGGTVIIYDDKPETIGKEAIKILMNTKYRKKLGKEARESMKNFKNKLTIKKWIKFIISVYKDEGNFKNFSGSENKINESELKNILINQVKLLKIREPLFRNITEKLLLNFTYLENILN